MDLDLNAPDHTTLSRRNREVLVPALRRAAGRPIHLIVDSIGLKIYGAGEWCSRKHRKAYERGGWRKLHIGVDDDGYIVAETLTQNTVDDGDRDIVKCCGSGVWRDQAASFRASLSVWQRSSGTPSTNGTPAPTRGSRCAPFSRRHRRCAMSNSL